MSFNDNKLELELKKDNSPLKSLENFDQKLDLKELELKNHRLTTKVSKLNIHLESIEEERKLDKKLIETLSSVNNTIDQRQEMISCINKIKELENSLKIANSKNFDLKLELANKGLIIENYKIICDVNLDTIGLINDNLRNSISGITVIKKADQEISLIDVSMLNDDDLFVTFPEEAKQIIVDLTNDLETVKHEKNSIKNKALEALAQKEINFLELKDFTDNIQHQYQLVVSELREANEKITKLKQKNESFDFSVLDKVIKENLPKVGNLSKRGSLINKAGRSLSNRLAMSWNLNQSHNNNILSRNSSITKLNLQYINNDKINEELEEVEETRRDNRDKKQTNININNQSNQKNSITSLVSYKSNENIKDPEINSDQVNYLKDKFSEYREEYEEQIRLLQKQNEEILLEVNMIEENNKMEISNLEKQNTHQHNEILNLKAELYYYENKVQEEGDKESNTWNEIKFLEQRITFLQEAKEKSEYHLQDVIANLENTIQKITKDTLIKEEKIDELEAELLNSLSNNQLLIQTRDNELAEAKLMYEKENIELKNSLSLLENNLKAMNIQNDKNKKSNELVKKELGEVIEGFKNQKKELEEEFSKTKQTLNKKISSLEKELAKLSKENSDQKLKTEETVSTVNSLTSFLPEEELKMNEKVVELEERNNNLIKENTNLIKIIKTKENEIQLLKTQNQELKTQYLEKQNQVISNNQTKKRNSQIEKFDLKNSYDIQIAKLTAEMNYYKDQAELEKKKMNLLKENENDQFIEERKLIEDLVRELKLKKVELATINFELESKVIYYKKYIKELMKKFNITEEKNEKKRDVKIQGNVFFTRLFK